MKLSSKTIDSALSLFLVFVFSVCANSAYAEHLLGDWAGLRPQLQQYGTEAELLYTTDILSNVSGGIAEGTQVLHNIDATLEVDTSDAGLWKGGTFFIYGLANFGDAITTKTGDLQVASSIEAPGAVKLFEAWYEHQLFDGALSVLGGLHDYTGEFYVAEYAQLLLNSSFGTGPELTQVPPSTFPTTAVGARIRFEPTDTSYLLAGAYDGVPGKPGSERGTHIVFNSGDGVFLSAEFGIAAPEERLETDHYKAATGIWFRTTDFEDFEGGEHSDNGGIYSFFESSLFREADERQGLGVFGQAGFTKADRNQTSRYFGGGFLYVGLVPGRDEDKASLGIAYARNGRSFRNSDPSVSEAETAIELTYSFQALSGLQIQPDFQYIINPGTDRKLDDAVVIGLRVIASL